MWLGKSLYAGSAGRLNSKSDAAFDEDAVCEIASMTKLVTAVAVMQVVEKGLVELDDDLGEVLPELSELEVLEGFDSNEQPKLGKQTKPVTLRYFNRPLQVWCQLLTGSDAESFSPIRVASGTISLTLI